MAEEVPATLAAIRQFLNNANLGVDGNQENMLTIRQAIIVAERTADYIRDRRAFGLAANAMFMQAQYQELDIMKQFCVFNCNTGILSGNFDTQTVPKVVQLITYGRMKLKNIIRDDTRNPYVEYQAYAMAELFGVHIPADRHLDQAQSHVEIISAARWLLEHHDEFMPQDWYDPVIGLGPNVQAAIDIPRADFDIHRALVILEAMALVLPTGREWLNGISFTTTVLTALAKKGTIASHAVAKIVAGVKNDYPGTSVTLSALVVKSFFNNFGRYIDENNAQAVFEHYAGILPNNCQRMLITIQQTADSGITVFNIIKRAVTELRDFAYWPLCYTKFGDNFDNFLIAIAAVGNNHYYGFRRDLGLVAAAKFKSLGYLSQQLLIRVSGDQPLDRYAGLRGDIPYHDWIDNVIERYLARNLDEDVNREVPADILAQFHHFVNQVRGVQPPPQ